MIYTFGKMMNKTTNRLRDAEDSAARSIIENALRMFNGNITKAAEYLGCTRRIFAYRMRGLGIKAKGLGKHEDAVSRNTPKNVPLRADSESKIQK